jgi:uncharacterized protein (TIGR03382 family)
MGARPGCLLLVVFTTGAVAGAGAVFYLIQLHVMKSTFDPGPFLLCWGLVVAAWLLGRALGHRKDGRQPERPPIDRGNGLDQAIRRRRGSDDEHS